MKCLLLPFVSELFCKNSHAVAPWTGTRANNESVEYFRVENARPVGRHPGLRGPGWDSGQWAPIPSLRDSLCDSHLNDKKCRPKCEDGRSRLAHPDTQHVVQCSAVSRCSIKALTIK